MKDEPMHPSMSEESDAIIKNKVTNNVYYIISAPDIEKKIKKNFIFPGINAPEPAPPTAPQPAPQPSPQPSTCKLNITAPWKRKHSAFTENEKRMICNVYFYIVKTEVEKGITEFEATNKSKCVKLTAAILGITESSIYKILKEHIENTLSAPKKSGPKKNKKTKKKVIKAKKEKEKKKNEVKKEKDDKNEGHLITVKVEKVEIEEMEEI